MEIFFRLATVLPQIKTSLTQIETALPQIEIFSSEQENKYQQNEGLIFEL